MPFEEVSSITILIPDMISVITYETCRLERT